MQSIDISIEQIQPVQYSILYQYIKCYWIMHKRNTQYLPLLLTIVLLALTLTIAQASIVDNFQDEQGQYQDQSEGQAENEGGSNSEQEAREEESEEDAPQVQPEQEEEEQEEEHYGQDQEEESGDGAQSGEDQVDANSDELSEDDDVNGIVFGYSDWVYRGSQEMPMSLLQDNNILKSLKSKFQDFINMFSPKTKTQQQKAYRFKIFQNNNKRIKKHNINIFDSYKLGQTPMMDLQQKQFLDVVLMELPEEMPQTRGPPLAVPEGFKLQPVDWRSHMNPVLHQGGCGSCWAFSVSNVLQALLKIKKNEKAKFSEQQMVDCCKSGCNGCRGGWPESAYDYLSKAGVAESSYYPYKGKDDTCKQDTQKKYRKIINDWNPYSYIRTPDALAFALKLGPVSVIIDARKWDPLYKSGKFNKCEKTPAFNHAVVCSGVQKDGTWIVRNSWGSGWGDKGYIYLPKDNACGISDRAIVPNMQFKDEDLGMTIPEGK